MKIQNGYAFKSQWFVNHGIRLVRNTNIGHGTLQWHEVARIPFDRKEEFDRFSLAAGDIVIALDRPLITTGLKVARITKEDLPSLLLQRVGKPIFKSEEVMPDFFYKWLLSPCFIDAINPGRSNGVPHISAKDIESIPFSLPSPAEQKRIVAKVDALMALCDELEGKLKQSQSDSEKLMAAVVHHLLVA